MDQTHSVTAREEVVTYQIQFQNFQILNESWPNKILVFFSDGYEARLLRNRNKNFHNCLLTSQKLKELKKLKVVHLNIFLQFYD